MILVPIPAYRFTFKLMSSRTAFNVKVLFLPPSLLSFSFSSCGIGAKPRQRIAYASIYSTTELHP